MYPAKTPPKQEGPSWMSFCDMTPALIAALADACSPTIRVRVIVNGYATSGQTSPALPLV